MGRIFYRLVKTDPPTVRDFMSHKERGVPLRNPAAREIYDGVSVQETEESARRLAHGRTSSWFIAELAVPDDGTIVYRQTTDDLNHFTLWATPDVLLACVVRTTPV